MTYRQKVLKAVYPVIMWFSGKSGKGVKQAPSAVTPPVSPYSLQAELNDGTVWGLEQVRGRYLLVVNTASDCGFTRQYDELQALSEKYPDRLLVLGFPANDFKQQEKGTDAEIAEFCRKNFGVDFPLARKTRVIPGPSQHPVYRWLTDPAQNGWNSKAPEWNFSKYLLDKEGRLLAYFPPGVSPLSEKITDLLK
jgi:glutathione peroxidase